MQQHHYRLPLMTLLPLISWPLLVHCTGTFPSPGQPMVINTWAGPFTAATNASFNSLLDSASVLDAVQRGCQTCQANRCDGTVGYGGSPDEACETTLDAMIMDGKTLNVGAVAGLRRVKDAIGVARAVLDRTEHSILVGDLATRFAVENGFDEEDLSTENSMASCEGWKTGGCQPNFRVGVTPDPLKSCGPYAPSFGSPMPPSISHSTHDTLSLISLTSLSIAAGTTTNGAAHKIPGRAGDGPIPGSGSYADSEAGACGATGDGDIMLRFLPCYQAIENLRRGMDPGEAAEDVARRIAKRAPGTNSGIVVVDMSGRHGGAATGWDVFQYAYRGGDMKDVEVVSVDPIDGEEVASKEL